MAKAKKLPSGQWRVLVYSHTENGKRKYESFTGPTKADAEMLAAEFAAKRERHSRQDLTVRDAIDGYIKAKENVLSPSTIKEYKRMQCSDYNNIMSIRLRKITSEDMQLFISDLSAKVSPKTVKNRYGLLRAAIGLYSPDINFRVTFPQKKVTRPVSPSEDAVRVLYKSASVHLRPCIALAMCGLRRGEIAALRYEDIENGVAHIHADMVIDSNNKWVYKEVPKTDGSDRFVRLPKSVLDVIGEGKGFIVKGYNPNSITQAFSDLNKRLGIHVRLHDLRHYYASIGAILGIPDVYLADFGGWRHDSKVMKSVYQNKITNMADYYADKMNGHLDGIITNG